MSVTDILEQVKSLSPEERDELIAHLQALQALPTAVKQAKTGAEIVALLEALPAPIEFVDAEIDDPVEWVKAQRKKDEDRLKSYWNGEV